MNFLKTQNSTRWKVNSFEKKISYARTLIHINQYNTDKQNLEKKIGDVDKKHQMQVVELLKLFWLQKLVKLRIKFLIFLNILLLKNLIS